MKDATPMKPHERRYSSVIKCKQHTIHYPRGPQIVSTQCCSTMGTVKASQVVVEKSCKQHAPHPQIEFDFVEKHIH